MSESLLLDDYGVLMLEKVLAAHNDYRATADEREDEQEKVLSGEAAADRFLRLASCLREREDMFFDLTIDLMGYIWMLESSPELGIRHGSCHVLLSEETMMVVDQLYIYATEVGHGIAVYTFLEDTVIPAIFKDAGQG